MITARVLGRLGINASLWLKPLLDAAGLYEIDTDERDAMWLAQCCHESGGFQHVAENLNYGPAGLLATFGKRFSATEATQYEHDPERIANRAYANRNGNGDEASGDGWMFRARGPLGLTGRHNYQRASDAIGVNLISDPELVEQPLYGSLSAAWFWRDRGCNELADAGQYQTITRRINGGLNGLASREEWLGRVRAAMK